MCCSLCCGVLGGPESNFHKMYLYVAVYYSMLQCLLQCFGWAWFEFLVYVSFHVRVFCIFFFTNKNAILTYAIVCGKKIYTYMQCICLCSVFVCAVYLFVQCFCLCSVFICAVYLFVQCICLCSVFICAVCLFVQCICLCRFWSPSLQNYIFCAERIYAVLTYSMVCGVLKYMRHMFWWENNIYSVCFVSEHVTLAVPEIDMPVAPNE